MLDWVLDTSLRYLMILPNPQAFILSNGKAMIYGSKYFREVH